MGESSRRQGETTPWEPDFDFYEARMDDQRLVIMVDLAAAGNAPVSSHSRRLQVRVQMLNPQEDGLRSAEEAPALFALEDVLVEQITDRLDAIYVGRFITRGATVFVFYAPPGKVGAEPLQGISMPAPYELEWLTEDDPEWSFQLEFMHPDPAAMQTIMNRRLLAVRKEHGDDATVPREVDHMVCFEDGRGVEQAASALTKLGYRVEEPRLGSDGGHEWRLEFHRDDPVDAEHVEEFCREILEIVLPLGGDYDGWGAAIVEAAKGRA